MEGEGVHDHSQWDVLQIKISIIDWMERLEIPVDQSEIYQWDLSRLQLRFCPAYSISEAAAMPQMVFYELLLFWFGGISCLFGVGLFYYFFLISCKYLYVFLKTVKKQGLWNSLLMETLQNLKIYVVTIYVQEYLSRQPVGLISHPVEFQWDFKVLLPQALLSTSLYLKRQSYT